MIKLPKDVKDVLAKLSREGYKAYCVGGCVRDSLCGIKPVDWDIATNATYDVLQNLFPDFKTISEKFSVIRKVYEPRESDGELEEITVDIATFRQDGIYSNGRRPDSVTFVNTLEEDLPRRDFTINAMGDNGFEFVDIFNGREDIKNKIIKTIGDPKERFKEDPVRMLRAIRLAADLGFDLSRDVFEAIRAQYRDLEKVSQDRFRNEVMKIMGANYGGRGLNMLLDTGIISLILAGNDAKHLTHREKQDLITLTKHMSETKPIPERRMGLFYSILGKRKAVASIKKLGFDPETEIHLIDATELMPKLYFSVSEKALKRFIYKYGMDRFDYCFNLEKAQRIALDVDTRLKIEAKMHYLNEVKNQNQPIFMEDLIIDQNDLIEAGICKDMLSATCMLMFITWVCHDHPEWNRREKLMDKAKSYKIFTPYFKMRYKNRINELEAR